MEGDFSAQVRVFEVMVAVTVGFALEAVAWKLCFRD